MRTVDLYKYNKFEKYKLIEKIKDKLGAKLGIEIGDKIGGGEEGIVYNIPGEKVIKISLPFKRNQKDLSRYTSLVNKKFKHIVNIYHTGLYKSLKHKLVFEYVIMEKLYPYEPSYISDFFEDYIFMILRDNEIFEKYKIDYYRYTLPHGLYDFVQENDIGKVISFKDEVSTLLQDDEYRNLFLEYIDLLLEAKSNKIYLEDLHYGQFAVDANGTLKVIDVAEPTYRPFDRYKSKNVIIEKFKDFTKPNQH
jgi:hypothetical protein